MSIIFAAGEALTLRLSQPLCEEFTEDQVEPFVEKIREALVDRRLFVYR